MKRVEKLCLNIVLLLLLFPNLAIASTQEIYSPNGDHGIKFKTKIDDIIQKQIKDPNRIVFENDISQLVPGIKASTQKDEDLDNNLQTAIQNFKSVGEAYIEDRLNPANNNSIIDKNTEIFKSSAKPLVEQFASYYYSSFYGLIGLIVLFATLAIIFFIPAFALLIDKQKPESFPYKFF